MSTDLLQLARLACPGIQKLQLVFLGDNHGGHYVVYINPKGDGKVSIVFIMPFQNAWKRFPF